MSTITARPNAATSATVAATPTIIPARSLNFVGCQVTGLPDLANGQWSCSKPVTGEHGWTFHEFSFGFIQFDTAVMGARCQPVCPSTHIISPVGVHASCTADSWSVQNVILQSSWNAGSSVKCVPRTLAAASSEGLDSAAII